MANIEFQKLGNLMVDCDLSETEKKNCQFAINYGAPGELGARIDGQIINKLVAICTAPDTLRQKGGKPRLCFSGNEDSQLRPLL